MTLLIAGYGDLGQTLAQQLQTQPHWRDTPTLALSRNPGASSSSVNWLAADLLDPRSLDELAGHTKAVSHVVYCAAPRERGQQAYRDTYVVGLQNLVRHLKRVAPHRLPAFLFVSSTGVYDACAQGVIDEQSPTEPSRYTGQILLEAERWLEANWPGAIILRLSGIYGPNRQQLLRAIASGQATLPEGNDYWANRIHVDDAAGAILHLFQNHQAGVFIGTDCQPRPLRELYTQIAQLLNVDTPPAGPASPMMGKKRLSNQKLLDTGYVFRWPDCIEGYRQIIAQTPL